MTSAPLVLLALDEKTVVGHVMAAFAEDRAADIGVVAEACWRQVSADGWWASCPGR
ncbi:hypothetical protein [Amycolatopsis sp. NBC_01480]|uniref:hypothetical protein n=1 Tax=Amycolatopsis sp. NBC_01480 TaxID=2903562 RepID=UPI002E2C6A19|nr:hypothetical protein [Amycolatopsis sp. NBC_01480]